ncbi:MAG: hypothetical protein JNK64_37895 [Myxococcales bacterium]|nr:hypothetical protein [Myxococcales bacterium]
MTRRRPSESDPEPPKDDDKKERVLHTRVPERLEAELKERAADLGVSVSNLVRNVLTHAFGLVGDIVADGAQVARSASGGRRPAEAPAPAARPGDVVGWQPMILGKNAVCAACNDVLMRGADGAVAITDGAGPRPIVCPRCLEEIRHGRDPFA